MSAGKSVSSIVGKIALLVALLAAFIVGLFGTIRLALYNPTVQVPNVVGKDRLTGESELEKGGLNLRVRMTRYVADKAPNTILDQSPHPDEVVKKGQTIAVVLARAPKENEAPPDELANDDEETDNANANTSGDSSNGNKSGNSNNANRKRVDNKNKNDNKNANNRNKNSNSAKGDNKNGNKNANSNSSNANNSNSKNANNNKAVVKNTNSSNANSGNRNRRATPEP